MDGYLCVLLGFGPCLRGSELSLSLGGWGGLFGETDQTVGFRCEDLNHKKQRVVVIALMFVLEIG